MSTEKYVTLPKPVNIMGLDFSHRMLVSHFLDTAKQLQTRSAARMVCKALDAIEAAEKSEASFYSVSAECLEVLHAVSEDDENAFPSISSCPTDKDGKPCGEPQTVHIPTIRFLPLIDVFGTATDSPPSQ